jgi:anti-anti-sigma regulatory factor
MSVGNDGTLRLWDLVADGCRRQMRAHRDAILDCALSGDGRLGVTACTDGTAAVWDLVAGKRLHLLEGHEGRVQTVRMTADARYALTGGSDGTLRVWEVLSGACIASLAGHRSGILTVAVAPHGRHAYTAGEGGTVRSWQLDWSLDACDPRAWDEGARRCLEAELAARTRFRAGASAQCWLARCGGEIRRALEDAGFGSLDGNLVRERLEGLIALSTAGEGREHPPPAAPIAHLAPAHMAGADLIEFRETVQATVDQCKGSLLLDMSRVTFAGSAALAFLGELRNRLCGLGAELIVCAPSTAARRLLADRELGRVFPSTVEARWFLPGSAGETWVPWHRQVR